jgi:hypothetical protein
MARSPADPARSAAALSAAKPGLGRFGFINAVVSWFAMSGEAEQQEDFAALYRRAFTDFGASALWSSRPVADPTPADALAITRSLRVEGDLRARLLAEQIEQACRRAPR